MSRTGSVHLVGSVPLPSVAEVMATCAERLGDTCHRLPDGEAGGWVNLPAATLGRATGLELVSSRIFPGTTHEVRTWRVKPESRRTRCVSPTATWTRAALDRICPLRAAGIARARARWPAHRLRDDRDVACSRGGRGSTARL
jgi:hypothetical protein